MEAGKHHAHYLLQAEWLAPSRHFLYRKASLAGRERILDLGCGTGVISAEASAICGRPLLGIDRDPAMVDFARSAYPATSFMHADENVMLKKGERFDLILLSFVLMWQVNPELFLKKLRRILTPGGTLLLLAEPDYGGRIDFPCQLDFLKELFSGHILSQGGDPFIGRKLKSLLEKAGWRAEVGMASHLHFPQGLDPVRWEQEWRFFQELAGWPPSTLKKILKTERKALRLRQRLVLFPVFYAIARNP